MSAASLEKGVRVIKEQLDAQTASFFSSCVHCGLCAEACLFYTETGDPRQTPINKVEPMRRVWEQEYTLFGKIKDILGLSRSLTADDFAGWESLLYDGCTMCGRCSLICPVGNDIVSIVRKLREGFAAAGYAPEGLVGATRRALEIGSPMGVKLPALLAQIRHVEKDTGLEIPLDREGADYMVLLSSMEIMNFPEYIDAIARIFKRANVSWTISTEAFEATNSGIQIGASDLAEELVRRIVVAAEKLKVKTVISPECGHAFMAIRFEGPNLIGRPYQFKVRHILEVLDDLRVQGRLDVTGKEAHKVTFHDPCQIVRRGGVVQPQRALLNMVATDFVEMSDCAEMNWCCGGGGGVSANERAEALRFKVFNLKKTQLEETGADILVTACANCRIILEEGLEKDGMDIPVLGLTELIADNLARERSAEDA